MLNYTFSIFGFIFFEIAFISQYNHCWLSNSLQQIQICKFGAGLHREVSIKKTKQNKKKNNRMGAWNLMFILLALFPMACKKANKVDSATSLSYTKFRDSPQYNYLHLVQ